MLNLAILKHAPPLVPPSATIFKVLRAMIDNANARQLLFWMSRIFPMEAL